MLVRRRLSGAKDLALECGLKLEVEWVPSASNKADVLTRVKQQWLSMARPSGNKSCAATAVDRGTATGAATANAVKKG